MTDETPRTRTPRLRFPEFQDAGEWEFVQLGQLLLTHPDYGVNAPSVPFSKDLPTYLRITDISEEGYYLSNKRVSVEMEREDDNYYLSKGDIVLARTGASVGKSYRYRSEDGKLVFAGYLIRIRPDQQKINSVFLSNFLSTQQYWKWVSATSARSGQPGINGNEYASLSIPLPPTNKAGGIPEQQRIADCLNSIDEVIDAHRAKLDALAAHKRGLMQQLFPAEGEAVPRLRFPEFADAGGWEVKPLGDLIVYENGKAHENYITDSGIYIVVNSKFISTEGKIKKYTNDGFCLAKKEDVLMVLSDVPNGKAIAKCYLVEKTNLYSVNQRICRLTPVHISGKFLFYVLNRNPYFLAFDDGVNQTNLRKEDVILLPFVYPSPAEQQRIADVLSGIDEQIAEQRRRLDGLRAHKRGLMQQLFPSDDEVQE